jgi:hypothetical protein
MKQLLLLFAFTILITAQERYSKIAVPVASVAELQRIDALGIAVDHFDGAIGSSISLFVSESEMKKMSVAGIPFTVQIHDWMEYYHNTVLKEAGPVQQSGSDTLKYFSLGTKGGHFTMAEMMLNLKIMKQLFPHLISDTIPIGTSIEGRTIYAVKISDNPDNTEANEPEVLYTAVHHAREPQGMTGLIYYMYWLLENYDKDPEATYLVNNRQLWFIPLVNPDGYEFNGAGGMWRKNRRVMNTAGGKVYGIDLNRNYGPYDMWSAPNGGSSTTQSSDTYRGSEPFSEPETQAIRNFMQGKNIRTCFNYHTYGNYIIYPWGYSSQESNDSLLFRQWTFDMAMNNRYSIGTDMQTVGYSTRGNSDDFMYGDTSKPRSYSMTPEIGTSGFYASPGEIIPLAKLNLPQNKLLAHYAGPFLEVRSFEVDGNTCSIILRNKGVGDLTSIPVHFSISNGLITPVVSSGDIPSFGEKEITVNFTAANGQPHTGTRVTITLKDSINVFYKGGMLNDSITFFTGNPALIFYDSANSTERWSMGNWGVTDDGIEENTFFTDSPNGDYPAGSDNSMTLLSPVNLTGYQFAELVVNTKWAIESTWDFGTIEVSTNDGSTWLSVPTRYSRKGSGRSRSGASKQPSSAKGFDAFVPGLTWVQQSADLTSFIGEEIKIRFRLNTDGTQQRDGWSVDDIRIHGYAAPSAVQNDASIPIEYSLSQNFPNPFNPATTIRFTVQRLGWTSLHVYNTVGQLVTTLVDKDLPAGAYSINFDAKQLSSGLYFYRFTSGTFTDVKKMTVVK